jgi:hypothetical protein
VYSYQKQIELLQNVKKGGAGFEAGIFGLVEILELLGAASTEPELVVG